MDAHYAHFAAMLWQLRYSENKPLSSRKQSLLVHGYAAGLVRIMFLRCNEQNML
jgi:hypothetical protein